LDPKQVPKLAGAGVDLRTLPLEPVDGFVLSRVDGRASLKELSTLTGVPIEGVSRSIEKLIGLGVVSFDGAGGSPALGAGAASTPPRGGAHPAQLPPPPPKPPSPPPPPPALEGPPLYDPRDLEEDVEIDMEDRKRILAMFVRLEDLDHYALLAVARDCSTKDVKRAYFELASKFHPDKFFRKALGSFKSKMETIFGRITEAHDTLRNKERRAEYDQYLADVQKTRGIEAMMAEAMDEVRRAEEIIRRELGPSGEPTITSASSPPPPSGAVPAGSSLRPMDPQARRDALARRLTGGAAVSRAPPPKTPSQPVQSAQSAMDALKRRYTERVGEAHRTQAKKYAAVGHQARANNDVVAAANAFRVALSFAPDDEELKTAHAEMQKAADVILAEGYMKQAIYEERFEHWPEAAKNWVRVVKSRPQDARAHERAAHALAKTNGNLHEAADLARRAVALDPSNYKYKITLANVFLAAGLALNAKRELEAALQLEPKNPEILALLKRIAKGS
jgi:curved DNA-binding protein CbpA/Tfp pilus assembly protein PilF